MGALWRLEEVPGVIHGEVGMTISPYRESQYRQIADLFHDAVHAIAPELYSEQEKAAWAPTPPDYPAWKARLAVKQPFVATVDEVVVGFIELEADGHIDCLYTHKDYQGQGVASQLLHHAWTVATSRALPRLYTEASKAAVPVFEKHGFEKIRVNRVRLRGQTLINYRMAVDLPSQPSRAL